MDICDGNTVIKFIAILLWFIFLRIVRVWEPLETNWPANRMNVLTADERKGSSYSAIDDDYSILQS